MKNIKILVVEDSIQDFVLIENELKDSGLNFTSKLVAIEEDFLKELIDFKPDIILSDYSLPVFNGLSALDIRNRNSPETPFIFVSGMIGEEFAVETLVKGATDYVFKNNLTKLNPAVERVLKESEEHKKRLAAEETLKKSEKKYRYIVENAREGILTIDTTNIVTYLNPYLAKMLGYKGNEMIGKNLKSFLEENETISNPEGFKTYENSVKQENKYIFKKKDDTKIYTSVESSPIQDKNNNYTGAIALITNITVQVKAENKLKSSLNEKDVLLHEIHHRVKNNMQIISSLLNLQCEFVDNKKAVNLLKESQNRVKSMAMIHENLYKSEDLTHINFSDYIFNLVSNLFFSYNIDNTQIKPILETENVNLNMETAIPCGLIISEIVSNSLKYAFPNGRKGEILISLKKIKNNYQLIIQDNGIGIPEEIEFDKLESLGLKLVFQLTTQINGKIEINRSNGTEFKILFNELKYKARI